MSPAAANPERVLCERSCILSTTSTSTKELMPILNFEKIQEKVEKGQDADQRPSKPNDGQVPNGGCRGNVEDASRKEDVMEIFDILSGKKAPTEVSNHGWKKLKHRANWWTQS